MENNKKSNDKRLETGLIDFDPDFGPKHPVNVEAARTKGLKYDSKKRAYVDEDGCLIRDEFGQPF